MSPGYVSYIDFSHVIYTHYYYFISGKANTFLTLKMTLSIQMIQFRSSSTPSKCPELITLTKYLPTLFLLWLLSTITGFYSPLYLLTNLLETSYLKMTLNSVELLIKITLFTNIIKTLTLRDLNPWQPTTLSFSTSQQAYYNTIWGFGFTRHFRKQQS